MKEILILIESMLMIVILAACSILITVTALPAWAILALIFVAFAAWLLFIAILATIPRDSRTYNNRGLARARKGDLAGAIADYDEAILFLPTDPEKAWVYACRARAHAAMGDVPAACESLAAAIALDPQWRDMARTEPAFDPIRHEPCFQALIAEPTTSP